MKTIDRLAMFHNKKSFSELVDSISDTEEFLELPEYFHYNRSDLIYSEIFEELKSMGKSIKIQEDKVYLFTKEKE